MRSNSIIAKLTVFLVVALLAGMGGAALTFLFFLPQSLPSTDMPERIPLPVQLIGQRDTPRIPVVSVAIVSSSDLRQVPGGAAIAESDIAGGATVLTSDGWLVTDKRVLDNVKDPVVVLPDGVVSRASDTVYDSATGLVFLRMAVTDLDVVAFGDSTILTPGSNIFRATPWPTLVPVDLESAHARHRTTASQAVRESSAVADRLLLAQSAPAIAAGSGLVNSNGALVGVLVSSMQGEVREAIPIEVIALALRNIVRTGAVHRPSLGISTVDLSELAERDPELIGAFGALVAVVDPQGPAAEAGVSIGDRITAIGPDALDGGRLLSDLLASYKIGEQVSLTIVRDSQELVVEVTVVNNI